MTLIFDSGNIVTAENLKKVSYFNFFTILRSIVMEKTLDLLEIGERGTVKSISGEGRIKRRLYDMGITPGIEVYLRKRAPFGDPLEITLRGYELSVRKSEGACIVVEV